jgi:hypothetical protein
MAKNNNSAAKHAAVHSTSSGVSAETSHSGTALAVASPEIEEIRRLHDENWGFRCKSIDNGIRIGELLTGLKRTCGHGKWLRFLKDNFPFSTRTAQVYLQLFLNRDTVKSAYSADIPIWEALLTLANEKRHRAENKRASHKSRTHECYRA